MILLPPSLTSDLNWNIQYHTVSKRPHDKIPSVDKVKQFLRTKLNLFGQKCFEKEECTSIQEVVFICEFNYFLHEFVYGGVLSGAFLTCYPEPLFKFWQNASTS